MKTGGNGGGGCHRMGLEEKEKVAAWSLGGT